MSFMSVVFKKFSLSVFICLLFASVVCTAAEDLNSLQKQAVKELNKDYSSKSRKGKELKKELDKIIRGKYSERTKIKLLKEFLDKLANLREGKIDHKLTDEESSKMDEFRESLVLVEGSIGVGSGFIAEIKGKKYIFTNAHVVVGNKGVKFTNADGDRLKTKGLYFNRDRDIAILPLDIAKNDMKPLIIHDGVSKLKIGTRVYVMGNSAGGGTFTKLAGKVKSIGADRIEVNAKFVGGNSGSPIMTGDGRVIGIATYAQRSRQTWVNKNTEFSKVRRFGYRIDNIKHSKRIWQKFNKKVYARDLKVYKRIQRANRIGVLFIDDLVYDGDMRLVPSNYIDYREAKDIVVEWNAIFHGNTFLNPSVFISRMEKLVTKPGEACKKHRFYYNVFKKQYIPREEALNKIIIKQFIGFQENITSRFNAIRARR